MTRSYYLEDLGINIAKDLVRGTDSINKFGYNPTANVVWETIWTPGIPMVYPNNSTNVSITSTSADDTPLGTGAQTVLLEGLDADYNAITETVTLNGLGPVMSTNNFIRLSRMLVASAGSAMGSVGIIKAYIDGVQVSEISNAYDNQSLQATYTIPKGKTGYITGMMCNAGKANKSCMVGLFVRESTFGDSGVFHVKQLMELFRNTVNINFDVPIKVPEKSDIELRAKGEGPMGVGGTFSIILEDN